VLLGSVSHTPSNLLSKHPLQKLWPAGQVQANSDHLTTQISCCCYGAWPFDPGIMLNLQTTDTIVVLFHHCITEHLSLV
jgi:hypothetical protein